MITKGIFTRALKRGAKVGEMKARIMDINGELRQLGYSWDDIEKFWKECIEEARARQP